MKSQKTLLIIVGIIIIALFAFFVLKLKNSAATPGNYDNFTKCLTNNEVKMFGAYWCPHCENQKKMLGTSFQYVNYIECSLPNRAGQTEICKQEGIQSYPTWEFKGGKRLSGELTFKQLSENSGCQI